MANRPSLSEAKQLMRPKGATLRTIKILTVLLLFAALYSSGATAKAASLSLLPEDETKARQLIADTIKEKIKRGTYFIFGIETQLNNSREELKLLENNIGLLKDKIEESKVRIEDINSQLTNLDRLMARNKEKIRAAELQIAEYANGILISEDEIKQKEAELKTQVAALDNSLSAYYMQNNVFFDNADFEPNLLAFLATDENVGEVLKENSYLFLLQNISHSLATKIMELQADLDSRRMDIAEKKEKMATFKILLGREQRTLLEAQESKNRLLNNTKGKQAIYETLLELSKKEEKQVSVEIERLKENFEFFQNKLDELKANPFAPEIKPGELVFEEEEGTLLKGDSALAWPVSPALGLSAVYHDSAYQAALGVEHQGVDIRLEQGSKVTSAADGVVTKVADNGFAYSYAIIAHPDKMMTLYGHLSEIWVNEGEIVRQGQVIGLSGGIPGTKGAGWLTTGAHLHLEAFKDFQHVDPLDYLPLELAPIGSLPDKYLKRLMDEEDKIRRIAH